MCKAFVIIFFPVFVVSNGLILPLVLLDNVVSTNLGAINFGEVWVFLIILQIVNSVYGLMLVCAKSELKCILIPWACQSLSIIIFSFGWTIVFSQDDSGGFEATEAITFAFMEAFSIYTFYIVFCYYREVVEKLTFRHLSVCFA